MHRIVLVVGASMVGLLLGWLCADVVLVNSGWALLPWAVVALALGAALRPARVAITAGVAYGFVLAFSFMAFSYDGTESLASRVPPFALLGLVGACCGALLASASALLRRRGGPDA